MEKINKDIKTKRLAKLNFAVNVIRRGKEQKLMGCCRETETENTKYTQTLHVLCMC